MRKNIFKKLVTTIVTAVMAVGMVAVPSMDAVAAETVYLHGAFNNWGDGVALTSTDGTTFKGDVDMTGSGNMCILLTKDTWNDCGAIVSLNGDESVKSTDGEGEWLHDQVWFDASGDKSGTYAVTWNKNTGAMTATIKVVSTTEWTYEYYVAGEAGLEAELWSNNDPSTYGTKGKMTANGTTWTYTATTTVAFDGSAGYNIIKIGVPNDDSARTIEWLKDGANPFACAYTGAGSLTITFDETAGTSSATFETANDGSSSDVTTPGTDTDTNTDNNAGSNSGATTPDTGDSTMVGLLLAVAAVSVVVVLKRRTVAE